MKRAKKKPYSFSLGGQSKGATKRAFISPFFALIILQITTIVHIKE